MFQCSTASQLLAKKFLLLPRDLVEGFSKLLEMVCSSLSKKTRPKLIQNL
jgi:hypothetical protein